MTRLACRRPGTDLHMTHAFSTEQQTVARSMT